MANQIFMMQADHEPGPVQAFGMDTWDHRSVAADLKANFDDPGSATVGAVEAGVPGIAEVSAWMTPDGGHALGGADQLRVPLGWWCAAG
nr:hypothetical protein [Jiangella alba]